MANLPRKASAKTRAAIVNALRDPQRVRLDFNGPSRSYLDLWGITQEGLYFDLACGLESDLLFLKPKTLPNQSQRYQCVLHYPADGEWAVLEIHVTLSPTGEPPRVKIAVHPSDTAQTLPAIQIDPPETHHENS